MQEDPTKEQQETNRLMTDNSSTSSNLINSFMFDVDFGNFRIRYFQGFAFFIFSIMNVLFSLINPLIINDQIYEDSEYRKVLNFRYHFGPSIDIPVDDIMGSPPFYAIYIIDILILFVYCIFIYYKFTPCISRLMQMIIYFVSSVSYLLIWYVFINFAASTTLAINTGHPYPLAMMFMSLFCIPALVCIIMKRYVDIRLKNSELCCTNVPRTVEWIVLILLVIFGQEVNCFSKKYDTFKIFILIAQSIISVYNTAKTLYAPNFTTLFIHCLSLMITTVSAVNSIIATVLYFCHYVSLKNQLIIFSVPASIIYIIAAIYSVIKWIRAKKIVAECDVFHPGNYDTSTLAYAICIVDPYNDQDKFPMSLTYEIREQFKGNSGLLIHFLSFKLFDRKCYHEIYNEANTLILTNSGNYINTIKLRCIISASVGDIVYLNETNIYNKKKLNILLKPCYREISRFWRAAVKNDIGMLKDSLFSLSRNIQACKHYFSTNEEFYDKFKRRITFELDGVEPDGFITEDMIERYKEANDHYNTGSRKVEMLNKICTFIIFLASLIVPTWILIDSFKSLNARTDIINCIKIQESLMSVAAAITEGVFSDFIKIDRVYNFTKNELIAFIKAKEKILKEDERVKRYVKPELLEGFFDYAYDSAQVELPKRDTEKTGLLLIALGKLTFKAKEISEDFGNVTLWRSNMLMKLDHSYFKDFKIIAVIAASIYGVMEICLLIIHIWNDKVINIVSWQPMIIEKNKTIDMMNMYIKECDELDVPSNYTDSLATAGTLYIFIFNVLVFPLSILLGFGFYSFSKTTITSLSGASYLGLSNSLILASLCTITASISYDWKDDRINIIFGNVTGCLLDLANTLTSSNYDVDAYSKHTHVNQSFEMVQQYQFVFPVLNNHYGDLILTYSNQTTLGRITDKLIKLALRSQSMTARYDTIPYQSMYSSVKIVLQTENEIHGFDKEVQRILMGIVEYFKFMSVMLYILYILFIVIIYISVNNVFSSVKYAIDLNKRLVTCVPNSPFFAKNGFMETQPKPDSILPIIIDTLPNGIIFFNTANKITFANTEAIYMYGEIVGEDISVLTTEIVDSRGIQRHVELKTLDSSLISFGFFDKSFNDNVIVATDTTNLKKLETQVNLLKTEIWQNFTLPAPMADKPTVLMDNPLMLDIVIDNSVDEETFDSMVEAIREETYNCQCIFHIDLQRYGLYAVFYSMNESLRRAQSKEAIYFGLAVLKIMSKFGVLGKIGIVSIEHLTAIKENTVAPKIVLIGTDLWKATYITKYASYGEICMEKSISGRIATNIRIVSSRSGFYGDEKIDYVIINSEEST